MDLINFTLEDTTCVEEALKKTNLSHYIFCSFIWAHGKATTMPVIEEQSKFPLEEYGIQKAKSEEYLHNLLPTGEFPGDRYHARSDFRSRVGNYEYESNGQS